MHEYNDKDNFEVFKKHGLYNSDIYETYTVDGNGNLLEFAHDDYGCAIIRKIR